MSGCCSAIQSGPTLHDPMDLSTPVFPVPHYLPGFSNPCPLSQRCHPTISPSVVPFSSCPQSFPASESFPISQLFTLDGQSVTTSASASVLPMNIQGLFHLGRTGWISLQSNGLSRVFSNTTVRKHQFFLARPSLWSVGTFIKSLDSLEKYIYYWDLNIFCSLLGWTYVSYWCSNVMQ